MYRCVMMYLCSISHLVTQGLPNANVVLRVHSGVVSVACTLWIDDLVRRGQSGQASNRCRRCTFGVIQIHTPMPNMDGNMSRRPHVRVRHQRGINDPNGRAVRGHRWLMCDPTQTHVASTQVQVWTLSLEFMLRGLQGSLGARYSTDTPYNIYTWWHDTPVIDLYRDRTQQHGGTYQLAQPAGPNPKICHLSLIVHTTYTVNVSNKWSPLGCRELNSEQKEHQQNSTSHQYDPFNEENISGGFFCNTLYLALFVIAQRNTEYT